MRGGGGAESTRSWVSASSGDDNPAALTAIQAKIGSLTKALGRVFIANLLEDLIFVPFGINLDLRGVLVKDFYTKWYKTRKK
jgi:hypothetical protein